MYIAIHVQPTKEREVMKMLRQQLEAFNHDVTLHLFERWVKRFVGNKLKEVKENIITGYLIAEIQGSFTDSLYYLFKNTQGVLRVLHQKSVSDEEFAVLREKASQGVVQIYEPEVPQYRRNNKLINRLKKAMAAPGISKKTIARLKAYLAKIREQHRQYQAYIRHISLLAPFKTFTGYRDVLEFPIKALENVRERLIGISFGWNDPMQLALRLAVSLGVKLE